VKIEVVGGDRFAATCASAAKELRAMAATNRAVASGILAAAHPPILTGRLASSLTTEATDTEAVVSSSLVYASVQERRYGFLAAALASQEASVASTHLRHVDEALAGIRGA